MEKYKNRGREYWKENKTEARGGEDKREGVRKQMEEYNSQKMYNSTGMGENMEIYNKSKKIEHWENVL